MSLFETLKNKYPIQQIAMYGDCIIIPIVEFGDDWEKRLKEEGYMSHIVQINYVGRWAVQLKKAEVYKKEPFPEPPKPKTEPTPPIPEPNQTAPGHKRWTKDEDKLLIALWEHVPHYSIPKITELIQETFPEKTEAAFIGRANTLKEKGLIKPRFKTRRSKDQAPEKISAAATTKTQLEQQKKQVEEEHKIYSDNELEKKLYIRREEMEEFIDSTLTLLKEEFNAQREELQKKIVDLDLRVGTLENDNAELANEIEFIRADFKEHEHSEITHKPLVPP
jgi:hypothetical protein